MANPSTNRVFYSYNPDVNSGVVDPELLSTYSDSLILDLKNRNIWFQGVQFGNSYWGSSYGETFNDFATNTATGQFSQATGTGTYAYGFASQANGSYTIAYNSEEVAFGKYNESIKTASDLEHSGSVFTIGDGKSENARHNIVDIRKDGSMIKNGSSYFNDYIYGPVAYTYVDHLGPDVSMDQIVHALLDEAVYYRPTIRWKYLDAENGTQWIDSYSSPTDALYSQIEVGSYVNAGVSIRWDYDSDTGKQNLTYIATNPGDLPGHNQGWIGLSYGVANNGIRYQIIDPATLTLSSTLTCNETQLPVRSGECFFNTAGSYTLARLDSVAYRECSYKYYPQLFDIDIYKVSKGRGDFAWYSGGTVNFGDDYKQYVDVRYKFWYGLSDILPKDRDQLNAYGESDWLEFPDRESSTEKVFTVGNGYDKKILWIAYPKNLYAIAPWSENYKVMLHQPDGIEFDLMSGWQTMKRMLMTIDCGNAVDHGGTGISVEYWVAYCEFQSQIGNPSASIGFKILAANLPDVIYMMYEDDTHITALKAGEDRLSYMMTESVDDIDDNNIWK